MKNILLFVASLEVIVLFLEIFILMCNHTMHRQLFSLARSIYSMSLVISQKGESNE